MNKQSIRKIFEVVEIIFQKKNTSFFIHCEVIYKILDIWLYCIGSFMCLGQHDCLHVFPFMFFICFVSAQVARYVKTKAFINQESLSAVHSKENSALNFTILVSYETSYHSDGFSLENV